MHTKAHNAPSWFAAGQASGPATVSAWAGSSSHRPRAAYTLVEIMVVIGIIALLMAILLPAINAARTAAKKTHCKGMLNAIDKGLQTFATDFGEYPDSSNPTGDVYERKDPIRDWGYCDGISRTSNAALSGAHWLARALVGPDFQGIDYTGDFVKKNGRISAERICYCWTQGQTCSRHSSEKPSSDYTIRRPLYADDKYFARDDDTQIFPGKAPNGNFKFSPLKQLVAYDGNFGSPVLYYRANQRAENPFCRTGHGGDYIGSPSGDFDGVYCHRDNVDITGTDRTPSTADYGWDFSGIGQQHAFTIFGIRKKDEDEEKDEDSGTGYDADLRLKSGGSFVRSLLDPKTPGVEEVLNSDGVRFKSFPPYNRDTFILITAGPDKLFGTDDDITNFK